MKRKHFLLTTLGVMPAYTFAKITSGMARTKEPFIVRSGSNRSGKQMMKFMGSPNDVIISKKDTDDNLSVFSFTGYKGAGTPLHVHFNQDEFFSVIDGKYRFVCGNLTEELNTGDTIFLPRNIPHQWLQVSENGKLIYEVNPAGTLEEMFKELNELKSPPTPEELKKILSRHGQKFLGPPLKL
jgi:quercetin dioxygenase-like cupin family protein